MKRRTFRTTIKWIATCAAVLLVIFWIGSAWYKLRCNCSSSSSVTIGEGRFVVGYSEDWYLEHVVWWSFARHNNDFHWWWSAYRISHGSRHISIPLWMPALVFAVPAVLMWRRDRINKRRLDINHCEHCNYNRTGLPPDRPCPECGNASSS